MLLGWLILQVQSAKGSSRSEAGMGFTKGQLTSTRHAGVAACRGVRGQAASHSKHVLAHGLLLAREGERQVLLAYVQGWLVLSKRREAVRAESGMRGRRVWTARNIAAR